MPHLRKIISVLTVFVHLGLLGFETRIAHTHSLPYRFEERVELTADRSGNPGHSRSSDNPHQCPACIRSFTVFVPIEPAVLLPLAIAGTVEPELPVQIPLTESPPPSHPRAPPQALS